MTNGDIKWTICVPTVPSRREIRTFLIENLTQQVAPYDDIELLVFEDNLKRNYGAKMQTLVDITQGEYISFVDDDDSVRNDYVSKIYPQLDGVDCVGFYGKLVEEDTNVDVLYSLNCKIAEYKDGVFRRPPQHITPIKTELVRQIPWSGDYGADFHWAEAMQSAGLIKTENFLRDFLYMYFPSKGEARKEVWGDKEFE